MQDHDPSPAGGGLTAGLPLPPGDDGRLRFLRAAPLFSACPPQLLMQVAAALQPVAVHAGAVICREGEEGDRFFVIESGTVVVTGDLGGSSRELARLGPGEFFGEIALLGGGRRTAGVVALTAAHLWTLTAPDFGRLVTREPVIGTIVERAAQTRRTANGMAAFEVENRNLAALLQGRSQIRIGSDPDNDLVFPSRHVSRHHALVERVGETYRLRDVGSSNGTFVNGIEIRTIELADGDEIWVADQSFFFDRRHIQRVAEPHGIRVDVTNVEKAVKGGKNLLQGVTLSVLPGELVAIVGGSGAGKTTLMDAISGVRPATGGQVLYNGREYYRNIALYRNVLGYVPQDDIIHTELPLRLTLRYAAKLRLPSDTKKADLEQAVDQAIAELGLTGQAGLRVKALSGGQRKRSSIGVELLTQPRIFFLDEPTSGLDPATDAQMMRLVRRLADEGSTVFLTTHATKNVMLCDKIAFLARGGHLAFFGPPARALEYFGAKAFDEIYERLAEEATPEEWGQRFRESPDYAQLLGDQQQADASAVPPAERRSLGANRRSGGLFRQIRQFGVLSRRNFDLYARNAHNVLPLIMQPLVMSLLLIALFRSGLFDTGTDNPSAPMQLLFTFTLLCFLFGLLFAIQEIAKEFPIFYRERMVSLAVVPYVLSKTSFLVPVIAFAAGSMTLVLRLTDRLPDSGLDTYGPLVGTLVLAGCAGLSLALMTSAAVQTPTQATDLLSLWIMPQVLFSGTLLAVSSMNAVGRALSNVTVLRWAFEATGEITDLNGLFESTDSPIGQSLLLQYEENFSRDPIQNWAILAAFIVVPFVLTCIILARKSRTR